MTQLLAIDWGTSSLRGALMDSTGHVLGERSFARGILTVPAGHFPTVFAECFGDWMTLGVLCLMSGMVGSRQGWKEAPYCPCPAGFADIAAKLVWLEPGRMAIVPGLSAEVGGVPDVMRGEEVQIFGALELLGLTNARLVLPGTHSKWVQVEGRRITGFSTWMTGEIFSLLRQHSILARMMPPHDGVLPSGVTTHVADADSAQDLAALDQGVAHALASTSLLHTAFSARTFALFDKLPQAQLPHYLSGLVIGEELRAQVLSQGENVVLMGSSALTERYSRTLAQRGVTTQAVGAEASWHGLLALAKTLDFF